MGRRLFAVHRAVDAASPAQAQPEIRTERGVIREVAAYASGGVIRWRLFLESRQPDDPIFGMWRRLFGWKRKPSGSI